MHSTENLAEAERLMTVCNSCRYCEGLCAVFPAMEARRAFHDADLNYLANLCHACGACQIDCQFAEPHEFNVNVPRVLAAVRADSYRAYCWPAVLQPVFDRNGLAIAVAAALGVAGFILATVLWHGTDALFADHGAFYALIPHTALVVLFGGVSLYALLAFVMGFRNFSRDIATMTPVDGDTRSVLRAIHDAMTLRYLGGGGPGCYTEGDAFTDRRRLFHHLTFYGFLLCFAATTAGTVLHYVFDHPAPYAWYELPKLFGIPGGVALAIGTLGLLAEKWRRDPALMDVSRKGMDVAFIVMLFLTAVTGLALMVARTTPAMGVLLALHLGVVFALFLSMPYGKFVHVLYRVGALVRYAAERRNPNWTADLT